LLSGCREAASPGAGRGYPDSLVLAEARVRGRALFQRHCALCHGVGADGRGVRVQALSGPPRDFTNPLWPASRSPGEVFETIRRGVPGTSMPSWAALTEADTWDLVAYVMSVAEEGT